jgi:hypothetical protein
MLLELLDTRLSVVPLAPDAESPDWARDSPFLSTTRSREELSLVCAEALVPADVPGRRGFRALRVQGPLDFDATGILSSLLAPLADAGVPVFTLSTYRTDYVLVPETVLSEALKALTTAGHRIRGISADDDSDRDASSTK